MPDGVSERAVDSPEARGEASVAESVYLQAAAGSEMLDIDRLCAERPELAAGLRHIHEQVLRALEDREMPRFAEADPPTRPLTAGADPEAVTVAAGQAEPGAREPGLLARLIARRTPAERYRVVDKIGVGGMGVIYRVWDKDLRRHSALKVIRPDKAARGQTDTYSVRLLDQFLEEAQVTGQLEHPGVVPVHELGLTADGRVQFTMRLVRGEDLAKVFKKVKRGVDGWNETRAVGVLLRVCETMAFAHSKEVIHRDLKPSNIMVGRFGETYVMDWGLARILGRRDRRNLAIHTSVVMTDGRESAEEADEPIMTLDGHVVGTPSYMSPEQATGQLERMGPRSDVYAMGAILYQLLAGRPPYVHDPDVPPSGRTILYAIQCGPPPPISKFNPGARPELVAICAKAMSRETEKRYATMEEMAGDLRAYLESRVVKAYHTGPIEELKKWVVRNRGFAAALGLLLVVFVSAGFALAGSENRRARETVVHRDEQQAKVLVTDEAALWPIHPDSVPIMDAWLARAHALVEKMPDYRAALHALERRAESIEAAPPDAQETWLAGEAERLREFVEQWRDPKNRTSWTEKDVRIVDRQVSKFEAEQRKVRSELERRRRLRRVVSFPKPTQARQFERLVGLIANLEILDRAPTSLIERVEERRRRAATLEQVTIHEASVDWTRAIVSIGDPTECPAYGGLRITPQLGLIPLGRNPATGLWEFWHVLSGTRPMRALEGGHEVTAETGIVLVLIPGGDFVLGAQSTDPAGANYDPAATTAEGPPLRITGLAPYLLSKYEMTQEQWYRATGEFPSENFAALGARGAARVTHTHPVEQISWEDCREVLSRWSLTIPTEAQWERAARAGTTGPYWVTEGPVWQAVNGYDLTAWKQLSTSERPGAGAIAPTHSDGYPHHAPVDSFPPNPFGLHHVLGNVREWTLDLYCGNYKDARLPKGRLEAVLPATGELRPIFRHEYRTFRGGGFEDPLASLRVSQRFKSMPHTRDEDIGVRPVRQLENLENPVHDAAGGA